MYIRCDDHKSTVDHEGLLFSRERQRPSCDSVCRPWPSGTKHCNSPRNQSCREIWAVWRGLCLWHLTERGRLQPSKSDYLQVTSKLMVTTNIPCICLYLAKEILFLTEQSSVWEKWKLKTICFVCGGMIDCLILCSWYFTVLVLKVHN